MSDDAHLVRVLVVDDSREFRNAACAWIETQSTLHVIGTADNGVDAVEGVERLRPDLVLMDVFMPRMDGFEATRRIKTEKGAPWVVMLSVHDESAVAHEAWASGADAFVSKDDFAGRLPELLQKLKGGLAPARGRRRSGKARPRPDGPSERSAGRLPAFLRDAFARS